MSEFSWTCPCCGEQQEGLPALAFTTPDNLPELTMWQWFRHGGYGDDLYVDRESGGYFVRCVLEIPIIGCEQPLEWGVWSSLSEANFKHYRKTMGGKDRSKLDAMFGWFSSHLPGYPETRGLKCNVVARDAGLRPLIDLEPTDHPLAIDQRNGITKDRAIDLAGPWL